MTGLVALAAVAALAQPAQSLQAQAAALEARVASGEAQCPDYEQLARAYRARGDFELGLATVRKCTTVAPDRPESYLAVATYLTAEVNALHAHAMSLARNAPAPSAPAPLECMPAPDGLPDGPAPIRVGGNVKAPMKRRHVNPAYPDVARAARVSGVVIMEIVVGPDGNVERACVLRSIPLLDAAAVDAVRQWEFVPVLLNGQAVPVLMTVTVNFSLM